MSVLEPVIDYLNFTTKRIYLLQGVTEYHPVEDIYKEIRYLRKTNETHREVAMPVSAYGNISKGGGKFTPRYAQFNNGWRIVPFDELSSVTVTGEQITDEGTSGEACMDLTSLTNSVFIHYEPPAAEIVRDEASLAAIAFMSFNNEVWLNPDTGYSKASFLGDPNLLGNSQYPVDNFQEAYDISVDKKLNALRVSGANTFTQPLNISKYLIRGDSAVTSHLTLADSAIVDDCEITEAHITGVLDGGTLLRNCVVDGITYFNGIINDSALTTNPVILGGTAPANFFQCYSGVPGGDDRPTIDFNHGATPLAVRDWFGGLELINKTQAEGEVSIDMSSGILYIRSSCTAGEITVRGVGHLVDESGDGCRVVSEGLLDPYVSQITTFNGAVHIDQTNGKAGTDFPIGNVSNPVNNCSDAIAIGQKYGIGTLQIIGTATLDNIDLSGWTIKGQNAANSIVTVNPNTILDNANILECTLTGVLDDNCIVRSSIISNLTHFNGLLFNCALADKITLGGTQPSTFLDCYGTSNTDSLIEIDCGDSACPLTMRNFSGCIRVTNRSTHNVSACINFSGFCTLESSLSIGDYDISGNGDLINNTTGTANVNSTKLTHPDEISDAVWNHSIGNKVANEMLRKAVISPDERTVTVYEEDGVTISHQFDISEDKKTRTPI